MNALIIDDAITVRMMTKAFLKELGFEEIHIAENGVEALDLLEKLGYVDLVLVDWNMPLMNGLEFIKVVRKTQDYSNLKIMMMTTENGMDKIIEAMDAGVNEYMMKPFSKEVLADKLQILGIKINA